MEKEDWIDDIFDSLDGIQRAKPDPAMFDRIKSSIHKPETKVIPLFWVRAAAVAAIVLLGVNILGISIYTNSTNEGPTEEISRGPSYQILSDYDIFQI